MVHAACRPVWACLALALSLPLLAAAQQDPALVRRPTPAPSAVGEDPPPGRGSTLQRVSVAELEQALKPIAASPDADAAHQLAALVLTERFSASRLAALKPGLPGPKARAALVALADASAFLNLPLAEVPADPAPDIAAQRRIVALAVDYLGKTIARLPNFFATRVTSRYEDAPQKSLRIGAAVPSERPFHSSGAATATVLYRDGREVVDAPSARHRQAFVEEKGLMTRGTFGPILSTVIVDAAHSQMIFSHWEPGTAAPLAVFRFIVPADKSHYEVAYRSPASVGPAGDMNQHTGYHGEVAIDPASGVIVRLAVQADLERGLPILRADILVEYGPVEIGGKTYTCPVRSVSVSRGRSAIAPEGGSPAQPALGPAVTLLNDVIFGDYHLFRSEVRILSGDTPAP